MSKKLDFDFILPTKIRFGDGVSGTIAEELKTLGKSRPMIITDKGLQRAGALDRITSPLEEGGLKYAVFNDIEPNPRDLTVQKAYVEAKEFDADILIAIGGGSCMDTAKAAAILMTHGGVINDYEGLDKVTKPVCDLIAIPTTVGTGSEVTFWSVITDSKRHFKMSVGSPLVAPRIALVDPELVSSLPPPIIASTGMDALTHAIEGYTCKAAGPITDACGLYAIKIIAANIRKAVYNDDPEARTNMLLGSLIAGICFGNSDIAGVHCMAEALGGLYDTPHGIANAILLPYVMEYNCAAKIEKFVNIAEAMGEVVEGLSARDAAFRAVLAVYKLNEDLEIPTLKEIGAREEDFKELAQQSAANVSAASNPRRAGASDFLSLFKKAYY